MIVSLSCLLLLPLSFLSADIPLFTQFPQLKQNIGYVNLADLPTPIHRLNALGNHINCPQLFIKRDDLTFRDQLSDASPSHHKNQCCHKRLYFQ